MNQRIFTLVKILVGAAIAVWVLLGGLVIEIKEKVTGGQRISSDEGEHHVWVQPSIPPTRHWFLGISKDYLGAPFYLKLVSEVPPDGGGSVSIDQVRVVLDDGTSTDLLRDGPVSFPYDDDTYRAPVRLALGTICTIPATLQAQQGYRIEVFGRINRKDQPSADLDFEFEVRQAERTVRVVPYWRALWEEGQSG